MGEFRMPSLGADMDVGTIVEWLVKPGDAVRRGQIVAVVDTAKAAIEIEAFEEGVVTEILVGTGVKVPVGTPLAMIGAATSAAMAPPRPLVVDSGVPTARIDYLVPTIAAPPAHPRATPPVRHLAHQLGIDLDTIPGTGPDGHITHDDVLRATPTPPPVAQPAAPAARPARSVRIPVDSGSSIPDRSGSGQRDGGPIGGGAGRGEEALRGTGERLRVTPRARRIAAERGIDLARLAASGSGATGSVGAVAGADVERAAEVAPVPASGAPAAAARPATDPAAAAEKRAAMRTAIANLMSRSNAEIPHYYVTQTIDLAPSLGWLRAHNAALPVARRVLPTALFLRATVLAAAAVPDLNGHWVDGALRPAERIDLGVAVATRGGGLVTPAIPDAGSLRIDALMAALTDLVVRARRGNLRQAEMAGGSITVSSLGETGPDALYGVIFPPQVALVGIGGIVERPWAVDGMLTVRPTVTVALAADHRASDGRTASAFLATFAHALQNPEEL